MNGIKEKLNKTGLRFSFSFFVLATILSVVFFIILTPGFQYYRSKISILFIPKSETTAFQSNAVMQNLTRLPKTLAFYERMLKDNPNLTDEFKGLSQDGRKKMWNKALNIKQEDGSTIIDIVLTAKNRQESSQLAKQTARTLFDTASFYYNIKSDVDFRIIDGPITDSFLKYWLLLASVSLVLGTVASFILNVTIGLIIPATGGLKIRTQRISKNLQTFRPAEKKEQEPAEALPKKIETAMKGAQAPENLPVFEEEQEPLTPDLSVFEETPEQEQKIQENKMFSEPTQEELKKRLNELLKGGM